jgi:hypothetical protein
MKKNPLLLLLLFAFAFAVSSCDKKEEPARRPSWASGTLTAL